MHMSSGLRVLENQDGELGIGDVGSLFWGGNGEGVSIDRKIFCLIFREKDDACNFYAHVSGNKVQFSKRFDFWVSILKMHRM